jgi:alcohol dehydrogenase (cytochrome c)
MQIWKYERKQKVVNPYESNRFNRGVAVLGQRVFFGTLDAALIALDARTGLPLWEIQVADTMEGYSITSPPLALKDKIIVGVAGGEYGVRGFLDAYDPKTGKRLWRFNAIPGPGEFGNDSWKGDSWKYGGGATWLTGSYDPELDTLYWTIGNPGPDMNAEIRKGDNLFSCSVVALDPNTGQRKWHYQFTPNDDHDWDANQDVILVDRVWQGQPRKLLIAMAFCTCWIAPTVNSCRRRLTCAKPGIPVSRRTVVPNSCPIPARPRKATMSSLLS